MRGSVTARDYVQKPAPRTRQKVAIAPVERLPEAAFSIGGFRADAPNAGS